MPYPPKYTPEQRKRAYELYWEGRDRKSERASYSMAEIERMTGVKSYYVGRIGRGER